MLAKKSPFLIAKNKRFSNVKAFFVRKENNSKKCTF